MCEKRKEEECGESHEPCGTGVMIDVPEKGTAENEAFTDKEASISGVGSEQVKCSTMTTTVRLLLLLTNNVLLGACGLGIWLAVNNFGVADPRPPFPPAVPNTTTPTSIATQHYNREKWYDSRQQSQEFREYMQYVHKTEKYARLVDDARMYVTVVCGVGAAMSALLLLHGLCSRKFFTTTATLYSSLGLLILTIVMILGYPPHIVDLHFPIIAWVIGIGVVIVPLLLLQLLAAIRELRRQKTGWPTVNTKNLYTLEAILVVARLTLAIIVFIVFRDSMLLWGFETKCKKWHCPVERCPLWVSLSSSVAAAYSLVASMEAVLSFFFGILHTDVAWSTSLISAVCNGWIAVMASPVFIKTFIGPYWTYFSLMKLAVTASIVTFVHTITCLLIPSLLRTPPKFSKIIEGKVKLLVEKLKDPNRGDDIWNWFARNSCSVSTRDIQIQAVQPNKKIKVDGEFLNNVISCVASVVLLSILGTYWVWFSRGGEIVFVLVVANIVILCRSLPPLILLGFSKVLVVPYFWRMSVQVGEGILVFFGFVKTLQYPYDGELVTVAGLQVTAAIVQVIMLVKEYMEGEQTSASSDGDQLVDEEDSTTPSPEKLGPYPILFSYLAGTVQ